MIYQAITDTIVIAFIKLNQICVLLFSSIIPNLNILSMDPNLSYSVNYIL
jgi:hypothetical protein